MRSENEIAHGYKLVQSDPEKVWGWGTPAGHLRAIRRSEMIISGADLRPGLHALEIGCGTGLFTEMFALFGLAGNMHLKWLAFMWIKELFILQQR